MGPVSIKMYDKFRLILRIETMVLNGRCGQAQQNLPTCLGK
jgi:hypothetical protein